MLIIKEPIKNLKNILSIEIRKELNLLPNIIKEKKLEKEIIYKDILRIKEKISVIKKELDKSSVNILNLEKDYTSSLLKSDKIKTNQKIILNLINNEIGNNNINIKILLKESKNEDIKELFFTIFNLENEYKKEISDFICDNNIEITKLLIGAYAYLKMIQNDIPLKYKQSKNKILELINKVKKGNVNNIYNLITSYMENIFIILENKEKNNLYNKKHESLIKKKNEIFLKLKLIEEQRKEKEEKLNLISNFIKDILKLIEKNKLLLNFPKNNNDKNNKNKISFEKNNIINVTPNNLNISCPKNTLNNEFEKNDKKISIINIDWTSTSSLEKNYYSKSNRKTIESLELNNISNNHKEININKYKNIYELEKDINEHFMQIKSNPLFKTKKKLIKKKINNNNANNNNLNNNNNMKKTNNKLLLNNSKEKKIEKISKNNTTMTYNTNSNTNSIINNINNLIKQNDLNKSYESTLNKKSVEREKEKDKIKLISFQKNGNKIFPLKSSSNSSAKKKKSFKEEKKNNLEEENKEKTNQVLTENNSIKTKKYISIKHNKTNLMKKKSLNKININSSKKEIDSPISFNNNYNSNNYSIRKNSPGNINSTILLNSNKYNYNKNKGIIPDKIEAKNKDKSPNNNRSNKNCHIIPFKKYKINYIKDKKISNKLSKNAIRVNTHNYNSDK